MLDDGQRERRFANIAESMEGVPAPVIRRQLEHFRSVHPDYAVGVALALDGAATGAGG